MWLRRIWTRIRDTVVKKFGEWVDKECPLIEDEDDLDGEKAIKEVVDKSLLEESIISSLEKAKKERAVKVKKRQGRNIWEVRPATIVDAYLFLINLSCMKREWLQQGGRIKMRSPPKVLTGNFRPSQLSSFLS